MNFEKLIKGYFIPSQVPPLPPLPPSPYSPPTLIMTVIAAIGWFIRSQQRGGFRKGIKIPFGRRRLPGPLLSVPRYKVYSCWKHLNKLREMKKCTVGHQ